MTEYPVMFTSQGTYVRIEQTSEAIRVTYEICRAGGARGLELRTAGLDHVMRLRLFITDSGVLVDLNASSEHLEETNTITVVFLGLD